jgi:hypothetical protein
MTCSYSLEDDSLLGYSTLLSRCSRPTFQKCRQNIPGSYYLHTRCREILKSLIKSYLCSCCFCCTFSHEGLFTPDLDRLSLYLTTRRHIMQLWRKFLQGAPVLVGEACLFLEHEKEKFVKVHTHVLCSSCGTGWWDKRGLEQGWGGRLNGEWVRVYV